MPYTAEHKERTRGDCQADDRHPHELAAAAPHRGEKHDAHRAVIEILAAFVVPPPLMPLHAKRFDSLNIRQRLGQQRIEQPHFLHRPL